MEDSASLVSRHLTETTVCRILKRSVYINKCVLKIYFQNKGLSDVEDDSLQFSSQSKFNPENIYDQMILIYA